MKEVSPMKAIRQKCLDCSCGQLTEIRECPIKDCALGVIEWAMKLIKMVKKLNLIMAKKIKKQKIKYAQKNKN